MSAIDEFRKLRPLDRRLTAARPDLAAASLRGEVAASRFVEGSGRRVMRGVAPLRRAPTIVAPLETEALYGETVTVFEENEGWAWAQLDGDGYVGYLPSEALGAPDAPTHRVIAPRSFAYPGPSIKLPPKLALPLGARLDVAGVKGDFAATADGLHVYAPHVAPLGAWAPDFVGVAERFLEAPYLWGGRTWQGVDCSGLVQTALGEAGVAAPRDTDMMEQALGAPLPFGDDLAGLHRGDLIFWKGHVGIMRDDRTLLHANAWRMAVASEPLAEARDRTLAKGGGPITSIRRL
jgi:cell wall-associated NlpC family hydrolase